MEIIKDIWAIIGIIWSVIFILFLIFEYNPNTFDKIKRDIYEEHAKKDKTQE
jgi:hypothetical protein